MFKILSTYICWKKYIKCNIWRLAARPSYIEDARFLKVKRLSAKLWTWFNKSANKGFLFSLPWVLVNLDLSHVLLNNTREQCNVVCFSKMSQAFNVTLYSGWCGSRERGDPSLNKLLTLKPMDINKVSSSNRQWMHAWRLFRCLCVGLLSIQRFVCLFLWYMRGSQKVSGNVV